jgi:hypothetical protein
VIFLLNFALKAKSQDSYFFKEFKLGFSTFYSFEFIDGEILKFASHELMLNTNISTSLTKNMNIGFQNLWFYVQDNLAFTKENYFIRGALLQYKFFSIDDIIFTGEVSFNKGNICYCEMKNNTFAYKTVENIDYIGFGGSMEFMTKKIPISIEVGWYFYKNISVSSLYIHHPILGLNYTFKKMNSKENKTKSNTIKTL